MTNALAFTITHEPGPAHMKTADWYVIGNRPDSTGDPCWGHFITREDALAHAAAWIGDGDLTVSGVAR